MGRETRIGGGGGRLSVSDSLSLHSTPHAFLRQLGIMVDGDQSAGAVAMQLNIAHCQDTCPTLYAA
jgi:hypothetical protein